MADMNDFKPVESPDVAKLLARKIESREKMTRVQIQIDVWIPTKVIVEQPNGIVIPMWAIKNAIK